MSQKILFGVLNFLISLCVTKILIPPIIDFGLRFNLIDHPDNRKTHKGIKVRIGGIAIFLGIVISQLLNIIIFNFLGIENNFFDKNIFLVLIGSLFFFLIGLFDDVFTISPFSRLFFQTIFTSIAWVQGLAIQSIDTSFLSINSQQVVLNPTLSFLFTFLWIVGVTNAINWMDGLDGLAAGIAIINLLGIVLISWDYGNIPVFYFAIISIGSCLGFLIYNFYPSKIYMGDSGSYLIGFNLASISILTFTSFNSDISTDIFAIHKAFILILVPIVDMIYVILKRLLKANSPFFPDRSHLHFRILKIGIKTLPTLFIVYGLVLVSTTFTYFLR